MYLKKILSNGIGFSYMVRNVQITAKTVVNISNSLAIDYLDKVCQDTNTKRKYDIDTYLIQKNKLNNKLLDNLYFKCDNGKVIYDYVNDKIKYQKEPSINIDVHDASMNLIFTTRNIIL